MGRAQAVRPAGVGASAGRRWSVGAVLYSLVTGGILLLAPLSAGQIAGQAVEYRSLLASDGPGVALLTAVPVLVCALPLVVAGRALAWACAIVLGVGVLAGLASVGAFYVPAVVLLAIGAARRT
ncbi:hypothetical protein [Paractinoplanes rishiriensis]|uniref:hypothetical protein n=1 Tax=Paractinoplanes rishiriensis TaxID=1050105 RepID=UPI001940E09C|nr:hypothetical protein [Actinoplanes rishiriensis]